MSKTSSSLADAAVGDGEGLRVSFCILAGDDTLEWVETYSHVLYLHLMNLKQDFAKENLQHNYHDLLYAV